MAVAWAVNVYVRPFAPDDWVVRESHNSDRAAAGLAVLRGWGGWALFGVVGVLDCWFEGGAVIGTDPATDGAVFTVWTESVHPWLVRPLGNSIL